MGAPSPSCTGSTISPVRYTGLPMPTDVELYARTYTTLLRSRGETKLRILEPSHRAMQSSLHTLADSEDLDLGAFLYATQRLPSKIYRGRVVIMGQEAEQLEAAGIDFSEDWPTVESPARRRRWHEGPDGQWVVLLSSTSDVDDLIPTLVAYQIEWNKLRRRLNAIGWPRPHGLPGSGECARALGGSVEDWDRLQDAWGTAFARRLGEVAETNLSLRVRMLGGSQVSYARMTRRWWAPVASELDGLELGDAPLYFVSSNTHSLVNLLSADARARQEQLVDWVERDGPKDLRDELALFRADRTAGSWENFLYFLAREQASAHPDAQPPSRGAETGVGVRHLSSKTALRVAAQIMPLAKLDPARMDARLGDVDADALRASGAVIVNVDYPLGLAAYNILREITEDRDTLRGVYVLGKAATLNADVGDVMISNTVYDEHSGTTYWLDNAFGFDDIAPYLRFGSGLDNQRAVTVRSTFLQNRDYLDLYYREAFTVVEMEAGPYCDAVYELTEADRYPKDGQVNMSKLPIDFGIVHYASDTPYTQARTLGARGMSYYGMDSTYATSIAILRRIFTQVGALEERRPLQPGA
jgi:hypothetical protein